MNFCCFLLFWESFNCLWSWNPGPIQVGYSAKWTSPNKHFHQKLKMSHVRVPTDFLRSHHILYIFFCTTKTDKHMFYFTMFFTSKLWIYFSYKFHCFLLAHIVKVSWQCVTVYVGISHICDPFYQNETLLCKTPNRDTAENTCGVLLLLFFFGFFFWDFCKIIIVMRFKCTVKVLDQNFVQMLKFWWFLAQLAIDPKVKWA